MFADVPKLEANSSNYQIWVMRVNMAACGADIRMLLEARTITGADDLKAANALISYISA